MSNPVSIVPPPLSEVLETSKQEVKFLKTDNTWNKEGLLAAFNPSTDKMIVCAASEKPLYYITSEGREVLLESFGYCAINGKPYHRDHLMIQGDVSKEDYPIQWEGRISKVEGKKPLTAEEMAIIRKEYGI